jgi:hypothetical protein
LFWFCAPKKDNDKSTLIVIFYCLFVCT